jgi:hypothetical protein
MTLESDLVGEQDPEERLIEQEEQLQERTERVENRRDPDHDGEVVTEDYDVDSALERLRDDEEESD